MTCGEIGMKLKYFVVQRLDNGMWTNYSCRFYLSGLSGALRMYGITKKYNPDWTLRIAKGIIDFLI